MSRKLFGTDGIRGVANERLTPEMAFGIGQAAGRWIVSGAGVRRVVTGADTRRSGDMLGAALAAGFCSAGVDVVSAGIVPTPTVSYIARTDDFSMGAIISASHNPAPDNGIKFVGHDGCKLRDEAEEQIERLIEEPFIGRPVGAGVGSFHLDRSGVDSYLEFLVSIVPERLEGLIVAVDAANGAAFELGPEVLRHLGAQVKAIGVRPDGMNINADGGATKPAVIQDFTKASGANIGVAFDGDADRAVFSDENGVLINGDRTIGIWSAHYQARGELHPPVVVGTVMSNGGFESYLRKNGVTLERTPVGDKYVARKIQETNARIGGEQNGHIIFPQRGPTGDGLVTMLELMRVIKVEGRPASAFSADYEPWPQVLVNVTLAQMDGWKEMPSIKEALATGETELEGKGRIVVRASGTQPMVRVMVEAENFDLRDRVAGRIVAAMEREAGGKVYSRVDLTHALGD